MDGRQKPVFSRKIALVFDMQGSLVGELEAHGYFDKSRLLRRIFFSIERLITKLPQFIICSSQASVNILFNQFGVTPARVALVNDGVDVTASLDTASSDALKKELSIPENKSVIVYTGALLESKGLQTLFNIILEASKRKVDCHFLIVGYPEQAIIDFLIANQLQKNCTIVGRIPFEQLGDYLGIGVIAIEPKAGATGEASGKLLNYMGAGLPVICFDTENNRQLLGDYGYYVSPGSITEFLEHIEELIGDPDKAIHHGAEGKKRVLEKFSWNASADTIYAVYSKSVSMAKNN